MAHGTTRQVLSLITNPIDVICGNLKTVHDMMPDRPDILGAHLEGPFLAMPRKGAHDPNCLVDPTPDLVSRMLDAADGCLRQITIAPELPHGIDAIRRFFLAEWFRRSATAMPTTRLPEKDSTPEPES